MSSTVPGSIIYIWLRKESHVVVVREATPARSHFTTVFYGTALAKTQSFLNPSAQSPAGQSSEPSGHASGKTVLTTRRVAGRSSLIILPTSSYSGRDTAIVIVVRLYRCDKLDL